MTEEQENHREALLNAIAVLIRVNYKILALLDQRLTTLEDECSKKEGK